MLFPTTSTALSPSLSAQVHLVRESSPRLPCGEHWGIRGNHRADNSMAAVGTSGIAMALEAMLRHMYVSTYFPQPHFAACSGAAFGSTSAPRVRGHTPVVILKNWRGVAACKLAMDHFWHHADQQGADGDRAGGCEFTKPGFDCEVESSSLCPDSPWMPRDPSLS